MSRNLLLFLFFAYCTIFIMANDHSNQLRIPLLRRALYDKRQSIQQSAIDTSNSQSHSQSNSQTISQNAHKRAIKRSIKQPIFTPAPQSSKYHSTPLYNHRSIIYTGDLSIGNQSFVVVFDTGSSDTWIMSVKSSHKQSVTQTIGVQRNHYYDAARSSSYRSNGSTWSIEYGEGRASGILSVDSVTLCGLTAHNVTFGEAQEYSANFKGDDITDGILGLSFSSASESHATPLLDVLYEQGVISSRMFSFYLTKDESDESSLFMLGEPHAEYSSRGIHWYPLIQPTDQWLIGVDSFRLNDAPLSMCQHAPCHALMDTGTSFLGLPLQAFQQVRHAITQARPDCLYDIDDGEIECQSTSLESLPTFTLYIASRPYHLTPQHYMIEGVVGLMAIDAKNDGHDVLILGDTFLKTFYCVFDMDHSRIGIAAPPLSAQEFRMYSAFIGMACFATILVCLAIVCNLSHKTKRTKPIKPITQTTQPMYEPLCKVNTPRTTSPKSVIRAPTPRSTPNVVSVLSPRTTKQPGRTFDWVIPIKS